MSAADHFRTVYSEGAADYHRLVQYEDAAGLLWAHLDGLVDWSTADVVEIGAGTGRLTVPLAARARSLRAFDGAPAMLAVARDRLAGAGHRSVTLDVAEHRSLPIEDHTADVLVEGWAVAHYVDWEPHTWPTALDDAVAEMRRVVRPGGRLILIETLGTGSTEPQPPTAALAELYERLASVHGFERSVVRTDYEFPDVDAARSVVEHFFGAEMLAALDGVRLAECTGVWTQVLPR